MRMPGRAVGITAFVLIALCVSGALGQGQTAEERVTIENIVGKAEVRSPKAGKWRPARVGMVVRMKWDVRTFVESSVDLKFASGTVLKLGENTVISLETLLQSKEEGSSNSKVKVGAGQLWANAKKLTHKRSEFSFETPTAVAAIRGTRLGLAVDKIRTIVDVYEGKVAVRNKGSRKEVVVTTRRRAVVRRGSSDVGTYRFDDKVAGLPAINDMLKGTDTSPADSGAVDTTAAADTTGSVDTTTGAPDTTGSADSTDASGKEPDDSVATDTTAESEASAELELSVDSPEQNTVVSEGRIAIEGTVTPGARVRVGDASARVGADGAFSATVALTQGLNSIRITAQLKDLLRTVEVTVDFRPPRELFLNLATPMEGTVIREPIIQVAGITVPGAEVVVADAAVSVDASGGFRHQVYIPNEDGEVTIEVSARYGDDEVSVTRSVMLQRDRAPLFLTMTTPTEGMVVRTPLVHVSGITTPEAEVEVDGHPVPVNASGMFSYRMRIPDEEGEITVEIVAREQGEEMSVVRNVVFERERIPLFLTVTTPTEGMVIRKPIIQVAGMTVHGAEVEVGGRAVTVDASGGFSYQLHIPDEEGVFSVEIVALYMGEEMSIARDIVLERERVALFLTVTTPTEGMVIREPIIRLAGMTAPSAELDVGGRAVHVDASGAFSHEIPLTEADIGEYSLETVASDDVGSVSETRTVVVDITSPQVNLSVPQILVIGQAAGATSGGELVVQAIDRTPGDEITVTIENNGSLEDFTLEPSGQARVSLDEGENAYSIRAVDLAGNASGRLTGEMYYLPGPLTIQINEPDENPYVIDDLPPMPRGADLLYIDLEVEIDDGIGDVPETILYCRVKSTTQETQLRDDKAYIYTAKVPITRGTNVMTIIAEDMAGNRQTRELRVVITE